MISKRLQTAAFMLIVLIAFSETLFNKQQSMLSYYIRLCVLSRDTNRLQSQCVLCNRQSFPATTQMCTDSEQLAANITIEQGFCLIVKCIEQVNQQPTILGRKKRNADEFLISVNWSDVNSDATWINNSNNYYSNKYDDIVVFATDEGMS